MLEAARVAQAIFEISFLPDLFMGAMGAEFQGSEDGVANPPGGPGGGRLDLIIIDSLIDFKK